MRKAEITCTVLHQDIINPCTWVSSFKLLLSWLVLSTLSTSLLVWQPFKLRDGHRDQIWWRNIWHCKYSKALFRTGNSNKWQSEQPHPKLFSPSGPVGKRSQTVFHSHNSLTLLHGYLYIPYILWNTHFYRLIKRQTSDDHGPVRPGGLQALTISEVETMEVASWESRLCDLLLRELMLQMLVFLGGMTQQSSGFSSLPGKTRDGCWWWSGNVKGGDWARRLSGEWLLYLTDFLLWACWTPWLCCALTKRDRVEKPEQAEREKHYIGQYWPDLSPPLNNQLASKEILGE